MSASRPRFASVALVFAGGAVGTTARAALDGALADRDAAGVQWFVPDGTTLHAFPLHTLAINVVGSLLLGILLEHLARRGPSPSRARLRLLLGTGGLGAFTTYSALSASTAQLLLAGHAGAAAVYALATVILGLLAAGAGIALSARWSRSEQDTGGTGPASSGPAGPGPAGSGPDLPGPDAPRTGRAR